MESMVTRLTYEDEEKVFKESFNKSGKKSIYLSKSILKGKSAKYRKN